MQLWSEERKSDRQTHLHRQSFNLLIKVTFVLLIKLTFVLLIKITKSFHLLKQKNFDLLIPSSEIRSHNNFTLEPCLINSNTIFQIGNLLYSNKLLFFYSNIFSGWVHPGFWGGSGHRSYHHHCPGKYKNKTKKIKTKTKTKTKKSKRGKHKHYKIKIRNQIFLT